MQIIIEIIINLVEKLINKLPVVTNDINWMIGLTKFNKEQIVIEHLKEIIKSKEININKKLNNVEIYNLLSKHINLNLPLGSQYENIFLKKIKIDLIKSEIDNLDIEKFMELPCYTKNYSNVQSFIKDFLEEYYFISSSNELIPQKTNNVILETKKNKIYIAKIIKNSKELKLNEQKNILIAQKANFILFEEKIINNNEIKIIENRNINLSNVSKIKPIKIDIKEFSSKLIITIEEIAIKEIVRFNLTQNSKNLVEYQSYMIPIVNSVLEEMKQNRELVKGINTNNFKADDVAEMFGIKIYIKIKDDPHIKISDDYKRSISMTLKKAFLEEKDKYISKITGMNYNNYIPETLTKSQEDIIFLKYKEVISEIFDGVLETIKEDNYIKNKIMNYEMGPKEIADLIERKLLMCIKNVDEIYNIFDRNEEIVNKIVYKMKLHFLQEKTFYLKQMFGNDIYK